jgi:hypothetical protein
LCFSRTFVAFGASAQLVLKRMATLATTRKIAFALEPVAGSGRYSTLIRVTFNELVAAASGMVGAVG